MGTLAHGDGLTGVQIRLPYPNKQHHHPFLFLNPPKSAVEGATLPVTKLSAAMVHGVGSGIYCFWVIDQFGNHTNLRVEVIRHTLLKIEESNGLLP